MLRQTQISRIRAGLKKAHDLLAGDTITHVDFTTGVETSLICIFSDLDQESFQGIQVDSSGVIGNAIYEVQFENDYLQEKNITITEQDHFLKDGRKLEFAKSEQLKRYVVPICAIHNFTVIRLIDAVRENATEKAPDDGWSIV